MRLAATVLFLAATLSAFGQDPTQQILLNQQTQQIAVHQAQQAAQQAQQSAQ